MGNIKIAIAGLGNCASSLIQGIYYYRDRGPINAIGLMHWDLGGYLPSDVEVVAAFDVDQRKVGHDLSEAIFARPNCTTVFCEDVPKAGVPVRMGRVLDGFSEHMRSYDDQRAFVIADAPLTPEAGLLTPSLKVRRNEIYEKYKDELDALYIVESNA